MKINIGRALRVSVDKRLHWALELVQDVGGRCTHEAQPEHLRVSALDNVDLSRYRELERGVYIGKNSLFDAEYGASLCVSEEGALVLSTDRPAMEWLMWLLHVAALRAGSAFVHGAGVERNGVAILFPSWGGVGKTALVSGFIKEYGWKLLGDDLVILEEDGVCHPFPKPMVLYPYHRSVFPEVFRSGKGPVAPGFMNSWLTSAAVAIKPLLRKVPVLLDFARRYNPQSARVPPVDVFGMAAMSQGGRIGAVVWLERLSGIDKPQLLSAGDTTASRIIGSTTNEYDPRCVRLTNIAMGLGILHLDEYWSGWRRIVEGAIANKPQYIMNLPESMPVADVPTAVHDAMWKSGLWKQVAYDV